LVDGEGRKKGRKEKKDRRKQGIKRKREPTETGKRVGYFWVGRYKNKMNLVGHPSQILSSFVRPKEILQLVSFRSYNRRNYYNHTPDLE
jgi:hypothetical protein